MEVYVTSDFVVDGPNPEEIMGAVVRIDKLEDSGFGVAVHFLPHNQQRNGPSENVLGSGMDPARLEK